MDWQDCLLSFQQQLAALSALATRGTEETVNTIDTPTLLTVNLRRLRRRLCSVRTNIWWRRGLLDYRAHDRCNQTNEEYYSAEGHEAKVGDAGEEMA